MTVSPGTYVRLRREAGGRTIDEVALLTATAPVIPARDRAEWIAAIEADQAPLSRDIVIALHEVFAFDRMVLVQLVAIHAGAEIAAPDICLRCGCSWDDPCIDEHQQACGWYTPDHDLCTACAGATADAAAAIALPDRTAEVLGMDLARGSDLAGPAAVAANAARADAFTGSGAR